MCQNNNIIKEKKFKQINYNERTQIERWYNIDKKSKSEIGRLLKRPEGSIRREIKRGLVDNLTTNLEVIQVYSADVAQQKCDYNKTGKGPELKLGKDFELKAYIYIEVKILTFNVRIELFSVIKSNSAYQCKYIFVNNQRGLDIYYTGNGNSIFLPTTGIPYMSDVISKPYYSYYLSSSINSERPEKANIMLLGPDSAYIGTMNRSNGLWIRPVTE